MDIKLNELFIDGEAPMAATDAAPLTPSPKTASFPDPIPISQPPKTTFVDSGSSFPSSSSLLSDDSSRSKPQGRSKPQVEDDTPAAAESDESDREFPALKIAEPETFPVRRAIIIAITNFKQL